MRRHLAATLFAGGLLLIGLASAFGQSWGHPEAPRSGVCFFENPNFAGRSFCAAVGDSTAMVPREMNDKISSIRVFGGAEVTVFKDRDFRGDSNRFGQDRPDLRGVGWNDRISSCRVDMRDDRGTREGRDDRGGPREGRGDRHRELSWGSPEAPRSGVCFYENPSFQGRSFCAAIGESEVMVPPGMNDKISSVRIFGHAGVTVFKDRDFRGDSRRFGRDVIDLRAAGFNDRISSFRVEERDSHRHRR
jgi:hypothetical protein